MHILLNKKLLFVCVIIVFSFIIALFQSHNTLNLSWDSRSTIQSDEVGDSYTEFMVRNTIKNHVFGHNHKNLFLVYNKGWHNNDYSYDPDTVIRYSTGIYIQGYILGNIAKLLKIETVRGVEQYISTVRFISVLMLSLCLLVLFRFIPIGSAGKAKFLLLVLGAYAIMTSYGFNMFSQNLYSLLWLYCLPLLVIPLGRNLPLKWICGLIVLLSFANACRSFSNSPSYILFCVAIVLMFRPDSTHAKLDISIISVAFKVGISAIFGLLLAMCLFVYAYGDIFHVTGGFTESAIEAFKFMGLLKTIDAAWIPKSFTELVGALNWKWSSPAFILWPTKIVLSEKLVIGVSLILFLIRIRRLRMFELSLFIWGFGGYVCQYVMSFKYMMLHGQYDWYVFALTIGVAFIVQVLFLLGSLGARLNGQHSY